MLKQLPRLTWLLIAAAIGGVAHADTGKTREQVRAETLAAIRNGDMLADGDADLTLREEFPGRYPALPVAQTKTRAEVKAETADAIRSGDMLADGEMGLTLREEFPQRYARH